MITLLIEKSSIKEEREKAHTIAISLARRLGMVWGGDYIYVQEFFFPVTHPPKKR